MANELSEAEVRRRAIKLQQSYQTKKLEYSEVIKKNFNLTDIVILAEIFGKVFTFDLDAPFDCKLTVTFRVREKTEEEKDESSGAEPTEPEAA